MVVRYRQGTNSSIARLTTRECYTESPKTRTSTNSQRTVDTLCRVSYTAMRRARNSSECTASLSIILLYKHTALENNSRDPGRTRTVVSGHHQITWCELSIWRFTIMIGPAELRLVPSSLAIRGQTGCAALA